MASTIREKECGCEQTIERGLPEGSARIVSQEICDKCQESPDLWAKLVEKVREEQRESLRRSAEMERLRREFE